MAEKERNKFIVVLRMLLLNPIMFVFSSFSMLYGVGMCLISTFKLSLYIGITGIYSLVIGICKMYGLKKYETAKHDKSVDVLEVERKATYNIAICMLVMSFLHFSFAIVSTFFYDENADNYGLFIIIVLASTAFVRIILSSIQSVKTRKNHSAIIHAIRMACTANAFIALALTQRAILYFVESPNARLESGIGGIFFSLCAVVVCILMFTGYKKRVALEKEEK